MLRKFAKTKILATLGPASDSMEVLSELIEAGVDAFRLNFSHGNEEYFRNLFTLIDELSINKSLPISILVDLQGPKIRIGELESAEVEIKTGQTIEVFCDGRKGNEKVISCSYHNLIVDAAIGDKILIDDGLIQLRVSEKRASSLLCDIVEGGILRQKKGMNLPGMRLTTPAITEIDYKNLEFALQFRVDFIALSFVRSSDDILSLRKWLTERGKKIPIIAKIEKPEAVDKFQKILEVSDGIMVARGDLGVELQPEQVPIIQKQLIRECNVQGKLVITATQMLESMIHNPVPTRAEASDVANAVLDGTDVVMLSGETSIGKHPVEAVRRMNAILIHTESHLPFSSNLDFRVPLNLEDNLFDSTAKAINSISNQVNAKVIVAFTHFGRKAHKLSKFRPNKPIIAISDSLKTLSELNMHWGIQAYYSDDIDNEDIAIEKAKQILIANQLAKKGDMVLFTASAPTPYLGRRTWIQFVII